MARRTDRRRKSKLHTRNSCDHKAQLIIVSRTSTDEFQQQQYQDFEDSISKRKQIKTNKLTSVITRIKRIIITIATLICDTFTLHATINTS